MLHTHKQLSEQEHYLCPRSVSLSKLSTNSGDIITGTPLSTFCALQVDKFTTILVQIWCTSSAQEVHFV